MSATTHYEVRVIGHIWQPGIGPCCAQRITVTALDLMKYPKAKTETAKEYAVRMVQLAADGQLGDFRSVDAWDIVKVSTKTSQKGDTVTIKKTYSDLLSFTDEQACVWDDCMSDYYEDEDDPYYPKDDDQ